MSQEVLLVVDDEPRVLRALKAVFRSSYEVKTTTDCQEALSILKSGSVNTIISDQRMPEMRGVDLLSQAREIAPNTMRLLLTGYSDIPSILDAINEGEVYRYITKPWDQLELQSIIADAMAISKKLIYSDQVSESEDKTLMQKEDRPELLVLDAERDIYTMVSKICNKVCNVYHASTIEQSIDQFERNSIQVIVVKVPYGSKEYLSFLKLIKSLYPMMVTIAVMAESDADEIISLINEGQIYRYLPVTVPTGRTRICLQSAINYSRKLQFKPVLAERHAVATDSQPEALKSSSKNRLMRSISILKRRLFGRSTEA